MNWTIFLRQLFLCSGPWTLYFLHGMCVGFPTVLVPQLRRANQTISMEQVSWLQALISYSGIPWLILMSFLIIQIGRKKAHIVVCISTLIGFIIFFFSTNINHFLCAQFFHGALSSCLYTTTIAIITECTSSNYRGIFLTIKSATFFWGIFVANAIGTFFYWRYIVILALTCAVYTLFNVIIWPESPLWLANRGRFVECKAAHRWLKGDDEASERELQKMLKLHEKRRFLNQEWDINYFIRTVCRKTFLKPILLAYLLICIYSFSGKLVCTVYAIDILKKITSNESTAYAGMLILDAFTVASMYIGCILSKFARRRVILIGFSTVGIAAMVLISIYLYLVKLTLIEENKYVSIILMAVYSISISCGPMIMSTTIFSELVPLKSRVLSMCIIAFSFKVTYGTFVKISPLCFKHLAMHGTFALFAILSSIFLVLIYIYLPETKDKTIQEIDECLTGNDTGEEVIDSMKSSRYNNIRVAQAS